MLRFSDFRMHAGSGRAPALWILLNSVKLFEKVGRVTTDCMLHLVEGVDCVL